jgi:hypothetical protein
MQGLKRTDTGNDLQIDWSTIAYSKIEGFMAKYYKYVQGGYRLTFKLKKRSSN